MKPTKKTKERIKNFSFYKIREQKRFFQMIFEKSFVNYEQEAHEIENASKRPNRELFINNLLIDWLERLSGRSLIVTSITDSHFDCSFVRSKLCSVTKNERDPNFRRV